MAGYIPSLDLIEPIEAGETWAIARLITRAESGVPEAREAIGKIYRMAGRAHVVGITGVPGSGKSTLINKLTEKLRKTGKTIAIVAIDPTSPYSGGAILGDRIRMSDLVLDPGVYIRSMATHGAVGGMAHAALDVVDILDVAGFDTIIIETVGVGQDEVEIANASHTTLVVSAPGLGDEIQAIKAGILEIADVHIVSKSDRSDANRTLTDLKMMLKDGLDPLSASSWRSPVVGVSSYDEDGFDALIDALDSHRAYADGDMGAHRRNNISRYRLSKVAETLLLEAFRSSQDISKSARKIAARESDPYTHALALIQNFKNENENV
jgi:LAO/AO transport system kinase